MVQNLGSMAIREEKIHEKDPSRWGRFDAAVGRRLVGGWSESGDGECEKGDGKVEQGEIRRRQGTRKIPDPKSVRSRANVILICSSFGVQIRARRKCPKYLIKTNLNYNVENVEKSFEQKRGGADSTSIKGVVGGWECDCKDPTIQYKRETLWVRQKFTEKVNLVGPK